MRKSLAILLMVSSASSFAGKKNTKMKDPTNSGNTQELAADKNKQALPTPQELASYVAFSIENNESTPRSTILMMELLHNILLKKFQNMQNPGPRELNAFFRTQYLFEERIFGHQSKFGDIAFENYRNYDKDAPTENGKDLYPIINTNWRYVRFEEGQYIDENIRNSMMPFKTISIKTIHMEPGINEAMLNTLSQAGMLRWSLNDYKRLSYGLAELAAIYRLVTYSFDVLFEDNYLSASLKNTPFDEQKNPVLNLETWAAYKAEHYSNKSADKKIYLDPWVKVFDKYFSGEFLINQDIPYLPNEYSFETLEASQSQHEEIGRPIEFHSYNPIPTIPVYTTNSHNFYFTY